MKSLRPKDNRLGAAVGNHERGRLPLTDMDTRDAVIADFQSRYGSEPAFVVRAPGRVNIIGEHTDYNDGFVMPMAIDRATWIALRPREDTTVDLFAMNHGESTTFDVHSLTQDTGWSEYPKGVAWALREVVGYDLLGFDGTTMSDIPLGAGLSSSAAFELAVARALACSSQLEWAALAMAALCQRAENDWVGMKCGIMDQMISAIGREGKAVLIDCRDLTFRHAPLPENSSIVIMDTMTRRGLVESAYNERRQECEEAAKMLGVQVLRDVSVEQFYENKNTLNEKTQRRAKHVVTENHRTARAAYAMESGDTVLLGKLMNESHDSLRDDFEVTNENLDVIVNIARDIEGCYGARMTGAGFGGCAVALVDSRFLDGFKTRVAKEYQRAFSMEPKVYVCSPSDGASVEESILEA